MEHPDLGRVCWPTVLPSLRACRWQTDWGCQTLDLSCLHTTTVPICTKIMVIDPVGSFGGMFNIERSLQKVKTDACQSKIKLLIGEEFNKDSGLKLVLSTLDTSHQ